MSKQIKIGAEVIGRAAKGHETQGRVIGRRHNHGEWIDVNIAPKGKAKVIKSFRPGSVRAA